MESRRESKEAIRSHPATYLRLPVATGSQLVAGSVRLVGHVIPRNLMMA